jgi:hypothetical protein
MKLAGLAMVALWATLVAGCGEVSRTGRSPAQLVILSLEAASGAEPDEFGGTLSSDVVTLVEQQASGTTVRVPTIFGDPARVTMALVLRDPGVPGAGSAPSALNAITINRYRVTYRRADARNTPGVDVPYGFDSAVTFTVPAEGEVTAGFSLVRVTAKQEAPLLALASSPVVIQTIADVTFYGRDQAGNEVSVTGSIGVSFGNFGDPE